MVLGGHFLATLLGACVHSEVSSHLASPGVSIQSVYMFGGVKVVSRDDVRHGRLGRVLVASNSPWLFRLLTYL
jgi:hypothetical protein